MSLIVRSNIKQYAKVDDKLLNVSGDFADKLNKKVARSNKTQRRRKKRGKVYMIKAEG